MSLRSRLAVTLVVVVAVVLAAAGTAVYVQMRRELDDQLDAQLARLRVPAIALLLGEVRGEAPTPGGVFDLSNAYVELRGGDGQPVANGRFLRTDGTPLAEPDLPASLRSSDSGYHFEVGSTGAGEPVTYRVAVTPSERIDGYVVAALPTTDRDHQLRRLVLVEVLVSLTVLVVLGVLARLLAGAQLRPLLAVEDAADDIARSGDLTRRVPAGAPGTEMARLSTAFNEMLDEIEAAFAAKDQSEERLRRFVADASHELRTPLTSIQGYSELLERERDDPEASARSLARIRAESSRMRVLVDDLLLLARLDEGLPMRRDAVDLRSLAVAAAGDALAADPSRAVTVDAPDPVMVVGDPDRLAQVLVNLLTNARTHTPASSPIEVRVAGNGGAVVEVVDHGPGLSADERRQVFDRFWRADASRSRAAGGSGLGLSIVAAVVHAHAGMVEVTDTEGGGATFRVSLPLAAGGEVASSSGLAASESTRGG